MHTERTALSNTLVTAAGNLRAGDGWFGVASGRLGRDPLPIQDVKRDLKGRIRVDFGNGIVRTYEPGRSVVIASEGTEGPH